MDIQIVAHIVKTIEYRFLKSINGSTDGFGLFSLNSHTRCPNEIIQHMYELANQTNLMIQKEHFDVASSPMLDFNGEKDRFLKELCVLQSLIETSAIDVKMIKKLIQGPLSDMLTHIGQLAMLSGLYGNKIPKENYYDALL